MNPAQLDRWLDSRLAKLCEARRQRVREFVADMRINGFSYWTIKANVQAILTLGFDGVPYEELDHEKLVRWMERLDLNGYAAETIQSYRRRVKHFLRWAHRCRSNRDPTPEALRCIRVPKRQRELPEGVLSYPEIQRILSVCESLRNRALIHVAYESGCRAGEVLGLRIRDIEFDRHGGVILVHGKTGMRRIRLIESVHDLQLHLNVHLQRTDMSAPFWPGKNGHPLTVERFNGILKTATRKAEVNKRVYPHLLRHSRATHLAKVLTEDQLRCYFGWARGSSVPTRYVHLSGRDVDDALLKHYGVYSATGSRYCPRCGEPNQPEAIYCMRCSAILGEREAIRFEARKSREEEIVAKVVRKLLEIAPNVVERTLTESGAIKEMKELG